jgi:glycosyltransferase involved in cell wall biosynthesis
MRIIARLNIGGPAIHTILLTETMRAHGFETTLVAGICDPTEGDMLPLATSKGVEPVILPRLGRSLSLGNDLRTLLDLYRLMRRVRPEIVHTHTAKAGTVGRLAAWLARVPVVVHTFHGHVLRGYFGRLQTRFFIEVERALARITDRILVLGEPQLAELRGFGIGRRKQFRCVPLGLELEPFLKCERLRGHFRRELGVDDTVPLIGIVARLVPIKAHTDFLRAAQRLSARRPDARFVIVGDGELRGTLEATTAELGLEERVTFTGFRDDLPTIYADLDVVALTSYNEGLPVTIIEGLAAARPVVATDVGAVCDLVEPGKTGRLVSPGDWEGLADGMLALLENPDEAASMGLAGRRKVYPELSIDRLVRDVAEIYTEALTSEGRFIRGSASAAHPFPGSTTEPSGPHVRHHPQRDRQRSWTGAGSSDS